MPSSHTQLMFFFTAYIALWLYRTSPHRPQPSTSTTTSSSSTQPSHHILHTHCDHALHKPLAIVFTLLTSIAVAASRIVLAVHTTEQVIAGALIGAAFGWVWHVMGDAVIRPQYSHIEHTAVASILLLRDSSHIPNVMRHEYELHRRYRPSPILRPTKHHHNHKH